MIITTTKPATYDVLLVDPPWPFRVWSKDTGHGRSAESHYPTMSIDELCALPVGDLAGKNAALFLWCVWPSIFEYVPPLLEAWGFEYKTRAFTWAKLNKSGLGFFLGLGYYTRGNDEVCVLATRGHMPVVAHDVPSLLVSPVREHSRKPDEIYGRIERLYPGCSYLELFARRKARAGWHFWGNEVESDIVLASALGAA